MLLCVSIWDRVDPRRLNQYCEGLCNRCQDKFHHPSLVAVLLTCPLLTHCGRYGIHGPALRTGWEAFNVNSQVMRSIKARLQPLHLAGSREDERDRQPGPDHAVGRGRRAAADRQVLVQPGPGRGRGRSARRRHHQQQRPGACCDIVMKACQGSIAAMPVSIKVCRGLQAFEAFAAALIIQASSRSAETSSLACRHGCRLLYAAKRHRGRPEVYIT